MNLSGKGRQRGVELISLVLLVGAGYLLADQTLFDDPAPALIPTCTLGTAPCYFDHAEASLASNTVTPLIPTELSVQLEGHTPEHLYVELEGVEMNMGVYKLKLTPSQNNVYRGDLMLPICMESEMTWRGIIRSPDDSVLLPVDVRMAQ